MFLIVIGSVMGTLCKADSVVTRDEIQAVKRTFEMLNLDSEQREQAKAAFARGKQPRQAGRPRLARKHTRCR